MSQAVDATELDGVGGSARLLRGFPYRWISVGGAAAVVIAAAVIFWQAWPRTPGDGSDDVGFIRDMIVHHGQAVEMAMIIKDRSDDPLLDSLATDIILTQQGQIGMMRGWLDLWDLSTTGDDPHMAWMGEPTEGLMPGMATPEEVQQLRDLPVADAEVLFLRLMIHHHASGIQMAQAELDRGGEDHAKSLAESIVRGQFSEIQTMQEMLVDRGQPQEPLSSDMSSMPGMDHDAGSPAATAS